MVNVGDTLAADDSIMTVESDKAAMDIPSPAAGVVKAFCYAAGEQVSDGAALVEFEGDI